VYDRELPMPGSRDLDPSSSPRALLGAELRHAREKAGLSQEELGQRLFVSGSFIGQLEAGTRRMQREYARLLDEVLGTGDFFQRNCAAAAKSKYREHFAEAAEVEAEATAIREYTSMLILGLLQTPAYARAVSRAYQPSAAEEAIEALVTGLMERARILGDPTKPLLWTVIDEAALRRVTGGPEVMRGPYSTSSA
jgi:transcriptional regulator with XRE-family HTH domain